MNTLEFYQQTYGLIGALSVVFAALVENVGADVQSVALLFCLVDADGLNLYVYVGNNPLKYVDPTGHVKVILADISLENYAIGVVVLVAEDLGFVIQL
jgi:hypothetical protein